MTICAGAQGAKLSENATKPCIAIIEDDEATRFALAGLMRAKGFTAQPFESAEHFLASESETPQCIVTDIQMPGLTGIELKIRLDALHWKVPVIMITAREEQRLHKQALESGAFCLLRKPFRAEALISCIERALAR